jgi:hypothetical protein
MHSRFLPSGWRDEGSIVLEAALVLPIALMFILFFILLIRLSGAQMSLHGAASQVVRQVAADIYPVEEVIEAKMPTSFAAQSQNAVAALEKSDRSFASINQGMAFLIKRFIPEPARSLLQSALSGDWQGVMDQGTELAMAEALKPFAEKMLLDAMQDSGLGVADAHQVRVVRVQLPRLTNATDPYVGLMVEYDFPFKIPFIQPSVTLREQVAERLWIPDAVQAQRGGVNGLDVEAGMLQIVAITPNVIPQNSYGHVVARTKPGKQVTIQVQYANGTVSKAQGLGAKTADSKGYVSWDWFVTYDRYCNINGLGKVTFSSEVLADTRTLTVGNHDGGGVPNGREQKVLPNQTDNRDEENIHKGN